jgi:hypothetical protein
VDLSGSSTESAALRGLPGTKGGADNWEKRDRRADGADEVRKQLNLIESNLITAMNALREAAGALEYVTTKTEEIQTRQASTPCEICNVQPSQKAGWCMTDYEQWVADGRPDRTIYAMWRRQDMNSEGAILVARKPKPRVKT